MRHALGILGVLAAGVLLAVSAAMNWRFGFSLGRTEFDGQIYGAASAAADCLKALVPFFLFAAVRNRMWSQAIASAIVGFVVVAYSLTSALGHAALNRLDVAGQRSAEANSYKDLRAELARAQEQLGWIPQHRPALMVQSDIDAAKTNSAWRYTNSCNKVTGPKGRDFCQSYHALTAELAAADQAAALEMKISGVQEKLAETDGNTVMSEADPQAAVLAKLGTALFIDLKVEDVQTALTVFIALLLEVGSGFGMYIAFSQWRLYEVEAPSVPRTLASGRTTAVPVAVAEAVAPRQTPRIAPMEEAEDDDDVAAEALQPGGPRFGANDNRSPPATQRLLAPETDVERFYRESVESENGSSLTATTLYEEYCSWCEERRKEPLALPTFGRQFGDLGIQKAKVAGRVRYIGIALKSGAGSKEDKKLPALGQRAA